MSKKQQITLAIAMCFTLPACGGVIGEPQPVYESVCSPITQGSIDTGHPEVGIILSKIGGCTGTLITRNVALTARHCVQSEGVHTFILDDGRRFGSSSIIQHPRHDIALVVLEMPADIHVPIAHVATDPPMVGQAITIVGYGNTGDEGGWGTKRVGTNIISELNSNHEFSWVGHCGLCFGDSGGPSYNAAGEVIGVHSTGTCGDHSTDVRVDVHIQWIIQNI